MDAARQPLPQPILLLHAAASALPASIQALSPGCSWAACLRLLAWPADDDHRCVTAALLQERKEPATPASVGYDRHWTHTPDLPAAASTALVQQEGKRLSRHATADGVSLQLQGILRNPRQMPAVLNACSRLAQLTDVNLARNALDEPAAAQLLGARCRRGHGCSEMQCEPLCAGHSSSSLLHPAVEPRTAAHEHSGMAALYGHALTVS